jgi:hypothetical protein
MMYDLIVGGYLPGTNIQLSFAADLAFWVIFLVALRLAWGELRARLLESRNNAPRQPLHASQLHPRV